MRDFQQLQQPDSPDQNTPYAERKGTTCSKETFAILLQRAKDLDKPAIGTLYNRFLPAVYRYVLARTGDIPTAEDLTSETFVAMIRGIESTRAVDELGFVSWLLGIARNQVLMYFRRVKTRQEVELLPTYDEDALSLDEDGDPLLVLAARESWSETVNALEKLTADQKAVILLRCVLGYSTEEVASLLKKRQGTIRALQFRGLAALARQLNDRAECGTEKASERRKNHAG